MKKTEGKTRKPNPLCGTCRHPRSMHGSPPARCKAIGCHCEMFNAAAKP